MLQAPTNVLQIYVDTTISHNFPASRFYSFFGLNCHYILSEEVQGLAATSGISAKVYSASLEIYICVSLLFAPDCTYEMSQLEIVADLGVVQASAPDIQQTIVDYVVTNFFRRIDTLFHNLVVRQAFCREYVDFGSNPTPII